MAAAAGFRAVAGARRAPLLLLMAALAVSPAAGAGSSVDSSGTCAAGDPSCGDGAPAVALEEVGRSSSCAVPDGAAKELDKCIEGSKQWRWALARFQSSDSDGAREFLHRGYTKCIKKLGLERGDDCLRSWAEDIMKNTWLKQGLGVSAACKAEAQSKYRQGGTKVEKCAAQYSDAADEAEEAEEQRAVYAKILRECAGVSDLCARQNAYVMAENAQKQALSDLGV